MTHMLNRCSRQWRRAINATIAIARLRSDLSKSTSGSHHGLGAPEQLDHEFQNQNGLGSKHHDAHSQACNNAEANQINRLDRKLEVKNPEVEALKLVRDELVKQLDPNGIVLVLLAGISFLAILQPPGSFDNGKLQESLLVSLFMLLSTLSFLIACTGLGAVMVGCAELFRPFFNNKLGNYTTVSESRRFDKYAIGSESQRLLPNENGHRNNIETPVAENSCRGCREQLLGCWGVDPYSTAVDDIDVLGKLCLENVNRIRRIRLYLAVSLVLCIAAYICGALAVMVTNDRHQRYLVLGALAVGGVIMLYEACITVLAVAKLKSKSSNGSLETRVKGSGKLTQEREGPSACTDATL